MARKKSKQPERSFWEDAYDQCIALADSLDPLIELLQKNGQRNLASHLLTIFKGIPEAVAISTPEDILNRIGERIAAEQAAEMKAYIEKMIADMPEDEALDLATVPEPAA